jgi:hypothetical protein
LAVTGSVPHKAENQIDGLVANDRKIVISSEVMILLIVVNHLTVGVGGLNADNFGQKSATNPVLDVSKSLGNVHSEISSAQANWWVQI